MRWIAQHARPGDAVLINAGYAYPTFDYYYDGRDRLAGAADGLRPASRAQPQPGVVVLQTGSIGGSPHPGLGQPHLRLLRHQRERRRPPRCDEVARRHRRLWVLRIYDTVTDPQGFIRSYLDQQFLPLDDAGFGGASSMRVQLYRTQRTPGPPRPALARRVQANLGNQMRLLGLAPDGRALSRRDRRR